MTCKPASLVALVATLFTIAVPAGAQVTYYTTGSFGSGTSTTFGSGSNTATISFSCMFRSDFNNCTTADAQTVMPPPGFNTTGARYGVFSSAVMGSGANGSSPFTLNIFQTAPGSPNSASVSSTISGSVTSSGNSIVFNTSPTSVGINGITYSIDQGLNFVPSTCNDNSTGCGRLTVQGAVTTTPEPSSMALLGTGLIGLVPLMRRKKSKV